MPTDRYSPVKRETDRLRDRPDSNSTTEAHPTKQTDFDGITSSRQVSFLTVHEYVERVIATSGFPMVGSVEWQNLPEDDPRKVAAVYDAAQHWALYIENNQTAMAEASRAVSGAADWSRLATTQLQHRSFHAARPWMKRRSHRDS